MKLRKAAGSVLGAVLGLLVVVIGTVICLLVYGFFVATYNVSGGLNSTLTGGTSGANNASSPVAAVINNFFGTTNSTLPLLSLIPLIIIAGVVIFLIVNGFGGAGKSG